MTVSIPVAPDGFFLFWFLPAPFCLLSLLLLDSGVTWHLSSLWLLLWRHLLSLLVMFLPFALCEFAIVVSFATQLADPSPSKIQPLLNMLPYKHTSSVMNMTENNYRFFIKPFYLTSDFGIWFILRPKSNRLFRILRVSLRKEWSALKETNKCLCKHNYYLQW